MQSTATRKPQKKAKRSRSRRPSLTAPINRFIHKKRYSLRDVFYAAGFVALAGVTLLLTSCSESNTTKRVGNVTRTEVEHPTHKGCDGLFIPKEDPCEPDAAASVPPPRTQVSVDYSSAVEL